MTTDRPKTTGKRVQIYLDARHTEWWQRLPRYDRSRIVAEALDLYRAAGNLPETGTPPSPDCAADRAPSAPDAPRKAS